MASYFLAKVTAQLGHQVLTLKLPCCQRQLAPFPRETLWIALLYDVTWSIHAVSLGNGALCPWQLGNLNVKLRDQTYSTENGSTCEIVYIYVKWTVYLILLLSCLKGFFLSCGNKLIFFRILFVILWGLLEAASKPILLWNLQRN